MLKKLQVITLLVDWPREQLSLPNETLFWSNLNYNKANTNQVEKTFEGTLCLFRLCFEYTNLRWFQRILKYKSFVNDFVTKKL